MDVSNNTELTCLDCGLNLLTSLDVTYNTKLKWLFCAANQLTYLDVTYNTGLTWFDCGSNQIVSLDMSNLTMLETFSCDMSELLSSLDLSKNVSLTSLSCYNSENLSHLDVSNTKLGKIYCWGCNIRGDEMDYFINSLPLNTVDEQHEVYISWGGVYDNVCTTVQVASIKNRGWIPMNPSGGEYLGVDPSGINGVLMDKQIDAPIYDLSGKRLREPRKGINLIGGKKVLVK